MAANHVNRVNRVEAARQRKANQRHGPNGETPPKPTPVEREQEEAESSARAFDAGYALSQDTAHEHWTAIVDAIYARGAAFTDEQASEDYRAGWMAACDEVQARVGKGKGGECHGAT